MSWDVKQRNNEEVKVGGDTDDDGLACVGADSVPKNMSCWHVRQNKGTIRKNKTLVVVT